MANSTFIPDHPELICWGCEEHCRVGIDGMRCGKRAAERIPHAGEVFGLAWVELASQRPPLLSNRLPRQKHLTLAPTGKESS